MMCGESEDAGGLTPARDGGETARHFIRRTIFGRADHMPVRPGQGPDFTGDRPGWGDGMDAAIFECPTEWESLLPPGTWRVRRAEGLAERAWPVLALTPGGCRAAAAYRALPESPAAAACRAVAACRVLLAPGDCPAVLDLVQAGTVISYGLSPRDSLTLSSLTEPVLCVQRALPRLDGTVVDPQEFPLPPLPGPAEAMLPLLGLRLLQMPLTEGRFP